MLTFTFVGNTEIDKSQFIKNVFFFEKNMSINECCSNLVLFTKIENLVIKNNNIDTYNESKIKNNFNFLNFSWNNNDKDLIIKLINCSKLVFINDMFTEYAYDKMLESHFIFLFYANNDITSFDNIMYLYKRLKKNCYNTKVVFIVNMSANYDSNNIIKKNNKNIENYRLINDKIKYLYDTSQDIIHHITYNETVDSIYLFELIKTIIKNNISYDKNDKKYNINIRDLIIN